MDKVKKLNAQYPFLPTFLKGSLCKCRNNTYMNSKYVAITDDKIKTKRNLNHLNKQKKMPVKTHFYLWKWPARIEWSS